MRVENCPKKLSNCHPECPMYPCWALDESEERKKKRNDGWE
jgi:hypothetical protein